MVELSCAFSSVMMMGVLDHPEAMNSMGVPAAWALVTQPTA